MITRGDGSPSATKTSSGGDASERGQPMRPRIFWARVRFISSLRRAPVTGGLLVGGGAGLGAEDAGHHRRMPLAAALRQQASLVEAPADRARPQPVLVAPLANQILDLLLLRQVDQVAVADLWTLVSYTPLTRISPASRTDVCAACVESTTSGSRTSGRAVVGKCCQRWPSARTAQYTHAVLRSALQNAVREELLARNVARLVETPC